MSDCWDLMRQERRCFILGLLLPLLAAASGMADELRPPPRDGLQERSATRAEALLERAVAHIGAVGRDRAFEEFSQPGGPFVDGAIYVFCNRADGTVLANGGNPRLVGQRPVALRQPAGDSPVERMFRAARPDGRGWATYRWPNPATLSVQRKESYIIALDTAVICGAGYYLDSPP